MTTINFQKENFTPLEKSTLEYLSKQLSISGRPPTQMEISLALGVSRNRVKSLLRQLIEKGVIEKDSDISRGLRLTKKALIALFNTSLHTAQANKEGASLVKIPLLGNIPAGLPIEVGNNDFSTYDEEKPIEISSNMLSGKRDDLFALKVEGDSMIDALVADGDIIILRKQESALNGTLVAVWLTPSDTTTLKHWYVEGDKIRLQPANPTMAPIWVDRNQVKVQGKVVMVIRTLSGLEPYYDLCLDAAVPTQVEVNKSFKLAVSVRLPLQPILMEDELEQVRSENVKVSWPNLETSIRLRVEVTAPECEIHGHDKLSFQFHREKSPILRFYLTPKKKGRISIQVFLFQEDNWLGNAWVDTYAQEELAVGKVTLDITSTSMSGNGLASLRQTIDKNFNREEIRNLCFDLGIDHENLPESQTGLCRELVIACNHRGLLSKLIEVCQQQRPSLFSK